MPHITELPEFPPFTSCPDNIRLHAAYVILKSIALQAERLDLLTPNVFSHAYALHIGTKCRISRQEFDNNYQPIVIALKNIQATIPTYELHTALVLEGMERFRRDMLRGQDDEAIVHSESEGSEGSERKVNEGGVFELAETIVGGEELDRSVEEMWYGVPEDVEEGPSGRDDWEEDIEEGWESCYEDFEEPKHIGGKVCEGGKGYVVC